MAGFDTAGMRVGKRKLPVQLPQEAVQDFMAVGSAVKSTSDRGKPLKFAAGSDMEICADGDEIIGFIEGVELPNDSGRIPIGCRDRGTVFALDEAGSLTVGDLVVSGTQTPAGQHPLGAGSNSLGGVDSAGRVKIGTPTTHMWVVWEVYGAGADRPVLLRRA